MPASAHPIDQRQPCYRQMRREENIVRSGAEQPQDRRRACLSDFSVGLEDGNRRDACPTPNAASAL